MCMYVNIYMHKEKLMFPTFCFFLFKKANKFIEYFLWIFIGVQLLYNVVLVSDIQHSESAIYIYIHIYTYTYIYIYIYIFSFLDFLPIGHHRALNRVLCAIQ